MLPQIDNILFATDLSSSADNALRHALKLAQAMDAKVHILHVVEPLSRDAMVTLNMFMQDEKARSKAVSGRHASVRELLKQNQRQFAANLSADDKAAYKAVDSVELADGHVAEMILQRASELRCDMIVMATHEYSTGHTFLGTVAKRVLRRSGIPTLIVPQQNPTGRNC